MEHSFVGDSALGGSRTTLSKTRNGTNGFIGSSRHSLRSTKITVSGGPWNTIVVIEWDETNSGTDNVRTYNRGIHVVHLRWGRATKLIICPDTIGLMATLERLKAAGNAEALAAPIVG